MYNTQVGPSNGCCVLSVPPYKSRALVLEVCAVPWASGGCGGRDKGMATVSCCQVLVYAGVD